MKKKKRERDRQTDRQAGRQAGRQKKKKRKKEKKKREIFATVQCVYMCACLHELVDVCVASKCSCMQSMRYQLCRALVNHTHINASDNTHPWTLFVTSCSARDSASNVTTTFCGAIIRL